MYIEFGILALTICTIAIVNVKCPNIDIIFLLKLFLTIISWFVLYIPVLSMIMDMFICTEEADGVVFFDIDCNT